MIERTIRGRAYDLFGASLTAPPVMNIIPYRRGMSSKIISINSISYLMKCKQVNVLTIILIYYDGLTSDRVHMGIAPGDRSR